MNLLRQMESYQGEAIWYQGASITYPQLLERAERMMKMWGKERQLIALKAHHHPDTIVIYLAALLGRHPLILINPKLDEKSQQAIIESYQPNWGYFERGLSGVLLHKKPHVLDPELALLLTTSGSTGGVKLVQLSLTNLSANAASIADYLQMDGHSRVISALPLAYSYGLSLLNSHLWCGGSMALTEPDPMRRDFWQLLKEQRVTQLAGVPYSYQMYEQLRIRRNDWPDLHVLTQAGGHLDRKLAQTFAQWASEQGKDFCVMYGQTEATARIAYVPADDVLSRPDSIGIAIPGGELMIVNEQGQPLLSDNQQGELVYRGDNVMLGYAQTLSDLAKPSRPAVLKTGDLGYQDADGFFYVTGRLKRMIKLAGTRTALDALERTLSTPELPVVCCGHDDALRIAVTSAEHAGDVEKHLREQLGLHPRLFAIACIESLPHTANGKLDYPRLAQWIEHDGS